MKFNFLLLSYILISVHVMAQKEYTISVPTETYSQIEIAKGGVEPNKLKALRLIKEIAKYANLASSISCMEKINPVLDDMFRKEMKRIKEETPYVLLMDWDDCKFISMKLDKDNDDKYGSYNSPSITTYHIKLYPDITVHPNFPSIPIENSASGRPIVATFEGDEGWIAMGPYGPSVAHPTEIRALDELFYGNRGDLTFLCDRGKYKIYIINGKTENIRKDVRASLKLLGVNDIPE